MQRTRITSEAEAIAVVLAVGIGISVGITTPLATLIQSASTQSFTSTDLRADPKPNGSI